MKIKRIYFYIIKEFIPNYLLGFAFFSIFLLVQLLFQIVRLYVERNAPLGDVLELLMYGTAWVVSFSIPIAVLMGTVLSLSRISGDSEITAMKANGISLVQIFSPIIFMGLVIMAFNIYYYEYIYPWGMTKYYAKYANLSVKDPTTQLSENYAYEDSSSPYVIQVDMVERNTRELINVRISSARENKLIIAERGKFKEYDSKKKVFPLELKNTLTQPLNPAKKDDEMGNAKFYEMRSDNMILYVPFNVPDSSDYSGSYLPSWATSEIARNIRLKEMEYAIRMINKINEQAYIISRITKLGGQINYEQQNEKKEYTMKIIKANIEESVKNDINNEFIRLKNNDNEIINSKNSSTEEVSKSYILEFQKKWSYSFSCLVFALLGAPLAIFSVRSGKGASLGVSLIFIALWYGGHFLSERVLGGVQPIDLFGWGLLKLDFRDPVFRAWLPPICLLPVAAYLWYNKLKT